MASQGIDGVRLQELLVPVGRDQNSNEAEKQRLYTLAKNVDHCDSAGLRGVSPSGEALPERTGCGAAWLARLTGGQEVAGSNPVSPISKRHKPQWFMAFFFFESSVSRFMVVPVVSLIVVPRPQTG